ncbi:hypothetical protein F5Y13DRAFT_165461 [Hypoxylon sp. FL1857]|nr:hypothetical protein F5Y13DRAFT_165461 [Hypoxylon sp. FL1857]
MSSSNQPKDKGKGKGREIQPDDSAPVSSLDLALNEVIESSRKGSQPAGEGAQPKGKGTQPKGKAQKRKRDAASVPNPGVPGSEDTSQAKRPRTGPEPPLHAVRPDEIARTVRRGVTYDMYLRDDPTNTNFFAMGNHGRWAWGALDNEPSFDRATLNYKTANKRANNGRFAPTGMILFPLQTAWRGAASGRITQAEHGVGRDDDSDVIPAAAPAASSAPSAPAGPAAPAAGTSTAAGPASSKPPRKSTTRRAAARKAARKAAAQKAASEAAKARPQPQPQPQPQPPQPRPTATTNTRANTRGGQSFGFGFPTKPKDTRTLEDLDAEMEEYFNQPEYQGGN